MCGSKKYPFSLCGGLLEILRRGFKRPKFLKKSAKINWNFQRGAQRNKHSVGGVWICSGTTQNVFQTKQG